MFSLRPPERDIGMARSLLGSSLALLGAFALLLLSLTLTERLGLEGIPVPGAVIAASLIIAVIAAMLAPGRRPRDWYVADRGIAAEPAGLAGAALLAGLFTVALGSGLPLSGGDAGALATGMLIGCLLSGSLFAARLRRFGGYSEGDFLAARFGLASRVSAALVRFVAGLLLLAACLEILAPPLAAAFGISSETAAWAAAGLTVLTSVPGGMRSLVAAQAIRYAVIVLGGLAPAAFLTISASSDETGAAASLLAAFVPVFAPGAEVLAVAVFALGTAALPPLLALSHATASTRAGALASVWTILLALALAAGWLVLAGDFAERPDAPWVWFPHAEFSAVLPRVLGGLLTAGVLAALLAGAHAALFSSAAALSLEIWDTKVDWRGPAGRRLAVARLIVVAVAAAAAWLALRSSAAPGAMMAWTLALSAAAGFVPLFVALWWRRCSASGALLGTAAGSAVILVPLAADLGVAPSWMSVEPTSAGAVGVAAAFTVTIIASLASRTPPPESQALLAELSRGGERPPIRERPA
jgi:cation/acetate symporter